MDPYSLGQFLREAREALEVEIEDAVAKLKIRQPILEAFEAGEFDVPGLPEIQVRGMLRIYGRFLEQDEEHVLLLYDQMRLAQEKGRRSLLRRRRRRREEPDARIEPGTQPLQEIGRAQRRSSGCRRLVRGCLILALSLLALGVILFVTVELIGLPSGGDSVETPVENESGAETPTSLPATSAIPPSKSATPTALIPTASVDRAQYSGGGVLVSLLLTQRSWLSLSVDGVEQFRGIAAPGDLLEYSAAGEVRLQAANALALDVMWNGERQGQLGGRGQAVEIRYTAAQAEVELGPAGAPTLTSPTAPSLKVARTMPSAEVAASPAPTNSPFPSATPPPTATRALPPTATSQASPVPTITGIQPPTAILPPRVTQVGLPPPKSRT